MVKKLTEAGLKKQIARLRGFANYDGLRDELLRVLWSHAENDEQAMRVITQIVDTRQANENGFTPCPTPSELIAMIKSTPVSKPSSVRAANRRCPDCAGTGYARDFVLATRHGDHFETEIISAEQFELLRKQPLTQRGQAVYQGVHRCACVEPQVRELTNA